jgi:hypothetical protein
MLHIVFVAPRVDNTQHVLSAFAALQEVVLSVVSLDPRAALPLDVRSRLASHQQVRSALASDALVEAVRAIQRRVGRVERLVGPFEVQQLPLAKVRDALGIEGIGEAVARNFRDKDRMKDVLRAHGVPVARSVLARSKREVREFVDGVGLPIVVKPRSGVGAQGTFRVSSESDLALLEARGTGPSRDAPVHVYPERPAAPRSILRHQQANVDELRIHVRDQARVNGPDRHPGAVTWASTTGRAPTGSASGRSHRSRTAIEDVPNGARLTVRAGAGDVVAVRRVLVERAARIESAGCF